MNKEIWKDIPNYEGLYQASNLGRIKSLEKKVWNRFQYVIHKEKILKPRKNSKGYVNYALFKNGKRNDFKGHYLILITFIKEKYKNECINHKNGIKDDNRLCNLEWCTIKQNTIHAFENNLVKGKKKRYKYNKQTKKYYLDKHRDEAIEKARHVNSIPIIQYDLEGNFIKKWNSTIEAEKYYGKRIHIEREKAFNFIWRRENEINDLQ